MRILRHRVDGASPNVAAVAHRVFAAGAPAFWLDGGIEARSGMSYLGVGGETLTSSATDGRVTSDLRGQLGGSILDLLAHESPVAASGASVPLGWIGWFGYSLGEETTGVELRRPGSRVPESAWMRVDRVIAIDHATGAVELLALGETWAGSLADWRDETVLLVMREADAVAPPSRAASSMRWVDADARYLDSIATCLSEITEGDAYQLCLTTKAVGQFAGDPLEAYLELRRSSPTHHGGLLRIGDVALLSASPERFLSVTPAGIAETHPIKGTRPRGVTPEEDLVLAEQLRHDQKERAENLMIVDLMRNDLSRVCEPGSVTVPSLFEVQSYRHVHQLVSAVRGRLASGRSGLDAIAACFPAGSMTGAPKIRAMQVLAGLEQRARGPYSGAFGWVGADGGVELAMIIRSIVLDGTHASVGSGGGITASSIPEAELAEVKLKAAAVLAMLDRSVLDGPVLDGSVLDCSVLDGSGGMTRL